MACFLQPPSAIEQLHHLLSVPSAQKSLTAYAWYAVTCGAVHAIFTWRLAPEKGCRDPQRPSISCVRTCLRTLARLEFEWCGWTRQRNRAPCASSRGEERGLRKDPCWILLHKVVSRARSGGSPNPTSRFGAAHSAEHLGLSQSDKRRGVLRVREQGRQVQTPWQRVVWHAPWHP